MRLKAAIKNFIAPELETYGYQMCLSQKNNYIFQSMDGVKSIEFDIEKYPPKRLRSHFSIRDKLCLELKYLKPEFFPSSAICYCTQEEFENFLIELLQDIANIMIPYLDAMDRNYVPYTLTMSREISENTMIRATRFAEKWGLTMLPIQENMIQLDNILDTMRGSPAHRKEMFSRHEQQVIDMAAYFGELLMRKYDMTEQWYWRKLDGYSFYATKPHGYDPMRRTIDAWNCGHESYNYGFSKFPL